MASEIRVNKINSRTGVGTITLSPTGVDFTGITTAATLRATTGIVTSLTAGSLTSLGAVSGTTGTFSGGLDITSNVDITDSIRHKDDTDTTIRFPAADTVTVETAGSERLRIDSSGNFGLGTSSPGALIDAAGSNPTLRVRATTINTEVSTLRLTETDSYVGAFVKYDGSTNLTHIGTHSAADSNTANDNNGITIVRDNRNVGIKTSSPAHALDVRDASSGVIVARQTTNNGGYNIYEGDDSSGSTKFYVSHNGRVGASEGIIFGSDTSTANLLDDYEEGTWTVTLNPSSGFTPTSNTSTGYYTKIGRLVTVIGNAIMTIPSSLGSYTNNNTAYGLAVTGLPFTSINASSQGRSAPVIGVTDNIAFSGGTLAAHGTANSTQFSIFVNKDNGAIRTSPTLTASESINIHFCFTYFI